MRKLNLLFKSLFLLCALIVGSSAWADDYELYSGTITEGDYVIVYNGKAIKNTIASNRLEYLEVSPSNNKISNPNANIVWHIAANGNYWTLYNAAVSKYAASTNSNNQAKLEASVTNNSKWTITEPASGTYEFENFARADAGVNNKWLRNNGTYGFACYQTSTGGALSLYKKPASTKTATAITINGTPSTEVYWGEDVTSPTSATVKAGETTVGTNVTWSSTNTNVATINPSTGVISIVGPGSTTIKATFEETNTYQGSEASYELKVYGIATTLAELQTICQAYGNTAMKAKVTLNNVYVTGIKGNNAYISDGTNGAVIYKNSHGFNAGDKLSCSALEMTVVNYNGAAEITSLTSGSTGLTVTPGQTITPTAMSVNAITAANYGTLVKITGVTYDATAGAFKDNSDNSIVFYDNFSASPTLNDGEEYDVTGVILLKNNTIVEICPRNSDDVVAKTIKTTPTSAWKVGGNVVSSIAVTKGDAISPTFETNSTGTKTFVSSNSEVATVSNTGVISLTGTAGIATITATTEANNSYYVSSSALTVIVGEPVENAVFNFGNYQDYGSGVVPTSETVYVEGVEKTWTAGDVTMKTNGKIRWYIGSNGLDLKLYSKKVDEVETTKITISAPSGKKLVKFIIKGSSFGSMTADKGTYDSGTWTGSENEVTLTWGGSSTIGLSTVTVFYTDQEIAVSMNEYGYMTYCNKNVALSFGDLEAFVVSSVGADNVTLSPITQAPSNTPVVLKGAAGSHNLIVLESAESIETNKLKVSAGSITTTESETRYALANKNSIVGFYKVNAGTMVPEGKCYVSVSNSTPSARDFLEFCIEGEATSIGEIDNVQSGNEVFDLQGRRIAQPAKGLYIKNGKKVVIK
jgi:hypothetical protein